MLNAAVLLIFWLCPLSAIASEARETLLVPTPDEIPAAIFCLVVFAISYLFVMTEDKTNLRKSKPVILGAGIIWAVIAWQAPNYGVSHEELEEALNHDLDEYAGLALFLLTAMTYILTLEDANVFQVMRAWLVGKGLSYRALFWVTGLLAFFLSPVADNMTTALVMGTIILALGHDKPRFVSLSLIGIVVASNAGGSFSPFGDITTLMVWQAGHVEFAEFFELFAPAVVNFALPAAIMTAFLPTGHPPAIDEHIELRRGAIPVMLLFLFTIALAITFEQVLRLPAFMGMITGLSLLMFFGYYHRSTRREHEEEFDIFEKVAGAEWDTLFFFFGVIFSVGGLSYIGWLAMAADAMYGGMGATGAHVLVGAASAVFDNIPMMFAVLSMDQDVSHFQWLLVTLTCGVGGSLLSIGSAAGVALMGSAKGQYTFMEHLKWTPVIALGYAASIVVHFLVNG